MENARVSINKILNPEVCGECANLRIMNSDYPINKRTPPMLIMGDHYCALYPVINSIKYPVCRVSSKNKVKFKKAEGIEGN